MRGAPSLRTRPPLPLGAAVLLVGCWDGCEPVVAGMLLAVGLVDCTPALDGPDVVPVPSAGRAADG